MSEPDELYTLRAQYCLGHYQLALDEAKSVARRPMSPALKVEREEYLARSYIALGQYDKVIASSSPSDPPGVQALTLKAKFESTNDENTRSMIVDQLKTLFGTNSHNASVQLTTSQVLLLFGQTKEALQCVYGTITNHIEHASMALQIYLKIDRIDLAKQTLSVMSKIDEEAVITQLGAVHVALATGSSTAGDAVHYLHSLSEQYGPSPLLLNLLACAMMQQGDYAGAEAKLLECIRDHPEIVLPDTLINMICCSVQQNKDYATEIDPYVTQMKQQYPTHPYCAGLDRVTAAFDREAIKYKV